jgi:hypothetical protein
MASPQRGIARASFFHAKAYIIDNRFGFQFPVREIGAKPAKCGKAVAGMTESIDVQRFTPAARRENAGK